MKDVLQDDRGGQLGMAGVGLGGEGIVYRLADDARFAVELYLKPMPAERVRKIQLLASLPESSLDQFLARPRSLVWDGRRNPRGLISAHRRPR